MLGVRSLGSWELRRSSSGMPSVDHVWDIPRPVVRVCGWMMSWLTPMRVGCFVI